MGKQVQIGLLIVAVVVLGVVFWAGDNVFENLDAKHIMVIQSPIEGKLTVYTEPGVYYQGFGKVTKYQRRAQYAFNAGCKKTDEGSRPPKTVRFSDGGHADLCGAISWEMPKDPGKIIQLHKDFGSQEAIEQQLIDKSIDNAVYTSGPTMSSTESSDTRRTELLQIIDDQARNGIFETMTQEVKEKDPITQTEKTVRKNVFVKDDKGQYKRLLGSALNQFGLILFPLTISEISYDKVVESQIAERQKATTQVQIALANARRAEQEALTAEQQGKANAAKAKWEQETINAKEIALAEKELTVAQLGAKTAEQKKRENILLGEGEAARRQLVMNADGALATKLDYWLKGQTVWAAAFQHYQGKLVPDIVMGGNGGSTTGMTTAQAFMDMVMMSQAKTLAVDPSMGGAAKTAPKK